MCLVDKEPVKVGQHWIRRTDNIVVTVLLVSFHDVYYSEWLSGRESNGALKEWDKHYRLITRDELLDMIDNYLVHSGGIV